MSLGIRCLLALHKEQALALASRLGQVNVERQGLQQEMIEQALTALTHLGEPNEQWPRALCLFDPDWHQGVVGLVASKLKERFHRPAFAFARDANQPDLLKGSARSIAGVHLRDVLVEIDGAHPGLIERFGGHAMAAGLTLKLNQFERFKDALDHWARQHIDSAQLQGVIDTDGELPAEDLTLELAQQLAAAGPFGQQFPEPLFDNAFDIVDAQVMAEKHLRLGLLEPRSNRRYQAVWFNCEPTTLPSGRWRLVYQPFIDEWQNEQRFRLLIRHGQIEPEVD
jgi:single-stranded-DNA-specific exonuclease